MRSWLLPEPAPRPPLRWGGAAGAAGALMMRSGTGLYWWSVRNLFPAYGSVTFLAGMADPGPVASFDAPGPGDELGRYFGTLFKAPVNVSSLFKRIEATTVKFVKGSDGSKTAVIGQNMGRVKEAAKGLKDAEMFKPSDDAKLQWQRMLKNSKGQQIPDEVVKTT